MRTPIIVSLFSGAGGLDIGFHKAGFHTVYASDVWDVACETLKKNSMADDVECIDVRKIDFKKLKEKHGEIDCLIGGPPCPPYSQTRHYLIGKKDGFEDEKAGFAVPEYFRAVKELEPTVFFFENVDGFTFKTHLEAFNFLKEQAELLGYNITHKVVNAANYGVPQTRKRFICVGVKKDLEPFVFPEETHSDPTKKSDKLPWVTCREAIGEFDTITEEEKKQRPGSKDYELFKNIPPGDNYLYYTEKRGCKDPKFKWKSRYWTFLLKLTPDRPSWTIQASFSNNQGPFHWKNRFLRIEEIKRLQTFPDSYQFCGDEKEQWRQIGNAVPCLLAEVFAIKIKEDYFNE
ncbi:C-5 cytosine-specific family DNA methylase [Clostridium bornimense]|uniref:Cytosine-specific methyltransferase n=1 Tax=Clostridium bornimense TaxID=1216932 RepID=W6RT54_9CLOT|nr:DNA (cytosine-5-)-methyltransferase [Clostridium bornimense]CDM67811.1 C-5 cytosine-specific family DNA methylase [Clostridium bornimense]